MTGSSIELRKGRWLDFYDLANPRPGCLPDPLQPRIAAAAAAHAGPCAGTHRVDLAKLRISSPPHGLAAG